MREGWITTKVGDIADLNRERVDPSHLRGQVVRHYSIPAFDEAGEPIDQPAEEIKSQKFAIREDSLLVSLLNPRIPRVWLAAGSASAVCSTEFAVLSPTSPGDVDLDFLYVAATADTFRAQLQRLVAGTTGSRQRVKPEALLSLPIDLPPREQRHRIVDLVRGVDNAAACARDGVRSTKRATAAVATACFEGALDTRDLGSLVTMRSGPSWSATEETPQPVDGATPVLKITNTRPDGTIVMDERAYVVNLASTVQLLDESSLVLIRTNGNRTRIGNVYRSTPEIVGHAVSAFQFAARPLDPSDRDYIYWFLRTTSTQEAMSHAASGSTGLGNLALGWLRSLAVPWFPASERARIVETCEALELVGTWAQREANSLVLLRSALVDDLLSGRREIPNSYDTLLELAS